MMGLFDGKVTLVTGGSSGIGHATAIAFAREGADVVLADVDRKGAIDTISIIEEAGRQALFIQTDVSRSHEVQDMIAKTMDEYGRLDYAFNNAGILGQPSSTVDLPEEQFDRLLSVNLKGVWLCMKYEIPQILKLGKGAIVNTASVAGFVSIPRYGHYVTSKHGVIGLTKTAALEYADQGIRVNAVCPTYIKTPMITNIITQQGPTSAAATLMAVRDHAGFYGEPENIAEAVIWLCSDAASLVNGHAMILDGGLLIGDHLGTYYRIMQRQGLIAR